MCLLSVFDDGGLWKYTIRFCRESRSIIFIDLHVQEYTQGRKGVVIIIIRKQATCFKLIKHVVILCWEVSGTDTVGLA